MAPLLRLRPDEAAGGDESETDRTSAEEGRHRSTQSKEVEAVAAAYAIFAVVTQVLLAISRWALF